MEKEQNKNNKELKTSYMIKRFLPYYARHKAVLCADLCCSALSTVCELVMPIIIKFITERGAADVDTLTAGMILGVGGIYIVLRIIDAAASYYMAAVGHIMGTKIETDMRRDLFEHLHKLQHSYYDNTKVGTLMTRISSDLFDVTEFAHHCPEEFFIAAVKTVVIFTVLSFTDIYLTLIIFAVMPLMFIVSKYYNHKMREGFMRSRRQVGELNAQVEDSLQGVRVVKSFTGEETENEKFKEGNHKFLDIKSEVYKLMGMFNGTIKLFDGLMYIIVVVCGAFFMINDRITSIELVTFLLYATAMLSTVRRIIEFTEQFQRGLTGIERFLEIMDTEPTITDSENAVELKDVKGDIEFKNVSFSYSTENRVVLNNVNIKIKSGQKVALVGPSGGGKTTVCSLIPRFYEPTSGEITIDGRNIKEFTLESLRKQIGIVQQDVYLFYGTVAQNIEYGKPGATREEIIEAAKKAGADSFIQTLPNGYDTVVGERGIKLSGGQKQRVSIARVFLKDPPILILDEATSSLDNQSEKTILRSLDLLAGGRTTLTIAHRLTTVRNADKILLLTENGIEEQGTHAELMALKGLYWQSVECGE